MSDSCNPRDEEELQAGSSTESPCAAQIHPALDEDRADQQLLWLLDSVDQLLRLRESLSEALSHGWMQIATARYAMAPSCISQPVFSLKPCAAATVVNVSQAETVTKSEENGVNLGGRLRYTDSAPQFVLLRKCEGRDGIETDPVKRTVTMGLQDSAKPRQRHLSGISKGNHVEADVNEIGNSNLKAYDDEQISGLSSVENRNLKQRSEALAWLGALVSPRPRAAQESFAAALETLVKIATVQSSLLEACSEFPQYSREE